MRQSLSIMAATTAVVAVAAGSGSNSNSQYDSMESQVSYSGRSPNQ